MIGNIISDLNLEVLEKDDVEIPQAKITVFCTPDHEAVFGFAIHCHKDERLEIEAIVYGKISAALARGVKDAMEALEAKMTPEALEKWRRPGVVDRAKERLRIKQANIARKLAAQAR